MLPFLPSFPGPTQPLIWGLRESPAWWDQVPAGTRISCAGATRSRTPAAHTPSGNPAPGDPQRRRPDPRRDPPHSSPPTARPGPAALTADPLKACGPCHSTPWCAWPPRSPSPHSLSTPPNGSWCGDNSNFPRCVLISAFQVSLGDGRPAAMLTPQYGTHTTHPLPVQENGAAAQNFSPNFTASGTTAQEAQGPSPCSPRVQGELSGGRRCPAHLTGGETAAQRGWRPEGRPRAIQRWAGWASACWQLQGLGGCWGHRCSPEQPGAPHFAGGPPRLWAWRCWAEGGSQLAGFPGPQ